MKKILFIAALLLGIGAANAQIRTGYTNYGMYDSSGILITADSIDTCHDWRISPSFSFTNDDFDKLYTMWSVYVGNPFNVFVSKGLTYSDPVWITSLAYSKIIFTGATNEHVLGDGSFVKNDYWNTATTTSGVTTFYITSDKTSSGTGLYSTLDYVNPIINNSTITYAYSWSYNSTTKALTVTVQSNPVVTILSINVLGALTPVTNGTSVQLLVKGH